MSEERYLGLARLRAEGQPTKFDEGSSGRDEPRYPVGPPVYPPDASKPGLHWLRDCVGALNIAEWETEWGSSRWLLFGTEIDRSAEEIGAEGFTYHSAVIVPED
jgi:hypothetical protein